MTYAEKERLIDEGLRTYPMLRHYFDDGRIEFDLDSDEIVLDQIRTVGSLFDMERANRVLICAM